MSDDTIPPTSENTHQAAAWGGADPFPGEFRLERMLGRGAFGEVWLARDLSPLGRAVALKFLRPSGSPERFAQCVAILQNEAQLLASLRHPNIVPIFAWKDALGVGPCLVLDFIAGGSLESRAEELGPLPWQLAARYVADVADGLVLVHARGIIHRDVKPANMLLDPDADEALLTDFGIAARLADRGSAAGTPRFMAPEAFLGEVSPALDVYGLAASLFWLVTGQAPFDADDVSTLREAIGRGLSRPDDRFAGVPAPLENLLRAGLDCGAADRPALADFVSRLRASLNLLMADALAPVSSRSGLQILVTRQRDATSTPVAVSEPTGDRMLRDLTRVPRPPQRIALRTGDRVRIEVRAAEQGYLTVFNVGPTGNLNLLYPDAPGDMPTLLSSSRTLTLPEIELTPPAGRERLVALWTRRPLPLRLDELRSLAEGDEMPGSGAYRATRDMARVQQSMNALSASDRQVAVLELEHT